jgi:hypothetical protein
MMTDGEAVMVFDMVRVVKCGVDPLEGLESSCADVVEEGKEERECCFAGVKDCWRLFLVS